MAFPLSELWFRPPSYGDSFGSWRGLPEKSGDDLSETPALSERDRDIVTRVRAGDHAAFRELYESSLDLMLRLAYGYVRSVPTSQDVVADVFVALWERKEKWNPAHGVRAYLLAAVRHRSLDRTRHERVVAQVIESPLADDVGRLTHAAAQISPDVEVELTEQRRQLRQAIAQLSPDRRRALMLRWQEGLSPVEIAEAMGIPRASVDQLVSRAIKTLRAALKE